MAFPAEVTLFLSSLVEWWRSLTPIEWLLILAVPLLIDLPRSIGRCTVLLIHALYLRARHRAADLGGDAPTVSIIIPAHNEEASIRKSIEAAVEDDYPRKEIIVVDDGSNDRTYEYARPYVQNGRIKLFKRDSSSGSKTGALNYGFTFSTGELSIVVDADSLIERHAVREATRYFDSKSVVAVSGNIKVLSGDGGITNLLTKLQAYEYMLSFEIGRRLQALIGTLVISPGAFTCFRSSVGRQVGLFDSDTITEDFDFSVKMRKAGYRIDFAPRAIAWTYCPATWRSWVRQRTRWSHGQISTLRKHFDLFRKHRYNMRFVLTMYDMLLMDIVLVSVRIFWFASLAVLFTPGLLFSSVTILIVYLVAELFSAFTAGLLSPRRGQDLRRIYLAPLMVLFYRPLYTLVRIAAYIEWYRKRRAAW